MLEEYIRNFILIIAREWTEKSGVGALSVFCHLLNFFIMTILFLLKKTQLVRKQAIFRWQWGKSLPGWWSGEGSG